MKYPKLNYPLLSRALIALLFIIAGLQKVLNFTNTVAFVDSLGVPLPVIATLLVVLVELPIAVAYVWGYRVCVTGGILVVFTILATVVAHRDISAGVNLMMALKNLAIVGGILATTGTCSCGRCEIVR